MLNSDQRSGNCVIIICDLQFNDIHGVLPFSLRRPYIVAAVSLARRRYRNYHAKDTAAEQNSPFAVEIASRMNLVLKLTAPSKAGTAVGDCQEIRYRCTV